MFEELVDIVCVRWLNTILIVWCIIWIHLLSKKNKNFLLSIPLLIWLIQSLLFYVTYLAYYYDVIIFNVYLAENVFSYWATMSKTLGLFMLMVYLYYLSNSHWNGNNSV